MLRLSSRTFTPTHTHRHIRQASSRQSSVAVWWRGARSELTRTLATSNALNKPTNKTVKSAAAKNVFILIASQIVRVKGRE